MSGSHCHVELNYLQTEGSGANIKQQQIAADINTPHTSSMMDFWKSKTVPENNTYA